MVLLFSVNVNAYAFKTRVVINKGVFITSRSWASRAQCVEALLLSTMVVIIQGLFVTRGVFEHVVSYK